mmetsp:Transcript_21007/g.58508  ORF Transcript_21007/g.58508 Transcript_21007/m.58508 type:complete len:263 (+) Transcript_21007:348-1136(+)
MRRSGPIATTSIRGRPPTGGSRWPARTTIGKRTFLRSSSSTRLYRSTRPAPTHPRPAAPSAALPRLRLTAMRRRSGSRVGATSLAFGCCLCSPLRTGSRTFTSCSRRTAGEQSLHSSSRPPTTAVARGPRTGSHHHWAHHGRGRMRPCPREPLRLRRGRRRPRAPSPREPSPRAPSPRSPSPRAPSPRAPAPIPTRPPLPRKPRRSPPLPQRLTPARRTPARRPARPPRLPRAPPRPRARPRARPARRPRASRRRSARRRAA